MAVEKQRVLVIARDSLDVEQVRIHRVRSVSAGTHR